MRAEELSHVCLPSVDLDGILHQTIHDGIGVGISTEQSVPFLQWMLGAKKCGVLPVAPFHQIKQEIRLAGTNGAGCPFINNEKMILAETVQESRATAGCLGPGTRTPENALGLAEEVQQLRAENKRLGREIKRLREENEFLEEASAFFAASRQKSKRASE